MSQAFRLICFCCALTAFAGAVLAEGEYQQTKDSKTFVWNGTPKPGESATWSGDRDKENYATAFGTLTWYNADGKVYGVYYGNMVHGKFEGPVNLHLKGRTVHSYFADGGRVTAWAHGPAPSRMKVPEDLIIQRRKAEAAETERIAAERKKTAPAAEKTPAVAKTEEKKSPVAAPVENEKKTKTEPEKITPVENAASAPTVTPAESTPPTIAEEKSPPPQEKKESETSLFEPTPFPSSELNVEKTETAPPSLPSATATEPSPPPATTKESPADVSVNALTGPPASLRAIPESSPPASERSTSTTFGTGAMTEEEAINLADTEVRAQGIRLDAYERPKADHSAVKGKWSLLYRLKEGVGSGSDSSFTVTIEDKTRKVEVRP